jgi:branched-chain amino acid transport system ATP-binding protein
MNPTMGHALDVQAHRTGEPLLRIEHVSKAFGGVQALDDVSFSIAAGEMVALIGPNGAGKTTCFNIVNGQLEPDSGAVRLEGIQIDGWPPHRIALAGIGRTFQTAATFGSMTARENVQLALLAADSKQLSLGRRFASARRSDAEVILARVGAQALADRFCASLAYPEMKRVELAVALAQSPRLLLMDEPTAGTAPHDRTAVMELVLAMARDEGVAVLFTEHDVDVVFRFAARVIVLDRGRIIADGTPASVRADPRVQSVYLGT